VCKRKLNDCLSVCLFDFPRIKAYCCIRLLFGLQEFINEDIPDVDSVRESLLALSELVKEGGPVVREEVINAGGYDAITKAWAQLCYGGVRNAKVFS